MSVSTPLMAGKRGLVLGVANDRSIAWGIAKVLAEHGAEIAFTYQVETLKKRVGPLAESVNSPIVMPADVTDAASLDAVFDKIEKTWGGLDFLVHAIAFADRNDLKGRYVDTSRAGFLMAMEISCFSFTDLAQRAAALMKDGGSMVTMTYFGAERVMPHYNVMGVVKAALETSVKYLAEDLGKDGIRVNAISAGPLKTLASSGVGDFRYILKWNELNAPLRRNITLEEVGSAGLYLLSDLGSGVTGEIHHVDAGYHVVGMIAVDAVDGVRDFLAGFKPQS